MRKLLVLILCGYLIFAGCQMPLSKRENHYDRVSRKIEQLKAKASIGDNIKIVVNSLTVSIKDRLAIDSIWRYADKNIAITNRPDIYARSGLQIGVADENFKARLDIIKQQLKSSEESEIFLALTDGSSGYISIGKEISVPRFYYLGRWYSGIAYEFRRAGRSLEVTVQKLPSGLIDIELTPVFSEFLNDGGDLKLTELTTRVTVRPGQTLVIGGGDSTEENVATALFSYSKTNEKKQTLITVTPYVN